MHTRLWYIPQKEAAAIISFPPLNDPLFFGNDNPIQIEYCSGNGAWITERAQKNPDINFIAVEMRLDRARKIWAKIHNHKLNNLIVVFGESLLFTKNYIPDHSIDEIFINFPDPWPKRKHHKNRLINDLFLEEVARVLEPGKPITIVTDNAPYSEAIIETFLENPLFRSAIEEPYYKVVSTEWGYSFFDSLFREKGFDIRLHTFSSLPKLP